MKKAKYDTDDEIQQVKPDIIVHEYQQYRVSYLKMFRKMAFYAIHIDDQLLDEIPVILALYGKGFSRINYAQRHQMGGELYL
jgi:hypothetical protein